MIAVAYYYTVLGNTSRAETILKRAKQNAGCELDKRLADQAIEWRQRGMPIRPLLNTYDYVPLDPGAWGTRLGRDPHACNNHFPTATPER